MIVRFCRTVLAAGLFLLFYSCGSSDSPLAPFSPENEEEERLSWQEVLASDPSYPDNVYLTKFVSWTPGVVGASRRGNSKYTDSEGKPLIELTANALGPPEGAVASTGGDGLTCPVGINGEGIWEFDPRFVIVDGVGDDFITFTKTFAWGSKADGLCCELAFVEVSADGISWYKPDDTSPDVVKYDTNLQPSTSSNSYKYRNVSGLHGNEPTWANFRKDTQAQELKSFGDIEEWVDIPGESVSRYFTAGDPHLGGVRFDLSDFVLTTDSSQTWPADGKMKYLKIIDSNSIIDGQDYAKDWCLGANLMAAMGINTETTGGS